MRILALHCWKENLELKRPYTIAYHTISTVENFFILLKTDDGHYGIGAGAPSKFVTGEKMEESLPELKKHAEEMLIGQDIRNLNLLLRDLHKRLFHYPAARAAIDIALYDLWGKFINQPLVDWFGRAHRQLPTSITIGIKEKIEDTLAEAKEFKDLGFKIIKLKTGISAKEDIETLRQLRECVGSDMLIRIDANQGYTAAELQTFAKATANLDVEFYEQPFPADRLDQMEELPSELARLCAADENLHAPNDAIQLAANPQTFGIYNIKLMKCGGIDEALRIAQVAERSRIDLMWGCMDESIVSISAALHAALASPATAYLDLDGSFDLARDLVTGGFRLQDGMMETTGEPGLGVKLSFSPEDILA